jgi:hypothetical protein
MAALRATAAPTCGRSQRDAVLTRPALQALQEIL